MNNVKPILGKHHRSFVFYLWSVSVSNRCLLEGNLQNTTIVLHNGTSDEKEVLHLHSLKLLTSFFSSADAGLNEV